MVFGHMRFSSRLRRSEFCDFEELKPMKLELGEGSSSITGRGTVELTVKVKNVVNIIALQSVYYVKGFKLYKSDSKVCSLHGKLDDGLYRVQGPVQFKPASSLGAKGDLNVKISGNGNTESSETSKLESHAVSIDLNEKVCNTICDNCELSKSTRASFKSENSLVDKNPLELLHMDLWGPCRIPSLGGARIERLSGSKIKAIHIDRGDDRESHYNPSVESSDDSDDDSSPGQPQPLTPVRPAPKAPQRHPNVQEIPPYVSSRRKPVPVSTTPLKPTSSKGFNRIPIPNKPGWERVEVQRQSGATKGKWDIYFYAPGCKIPLRSRPELRDYCEQALKIPYNPDELLLSHAAQARGSAHLELDHGVRRLALVSGGTLGIADDRIFC
uniref:MBD domain-containing protein n=1 Tax=Strigamia maritima TaxID=126957 RepID=T1JK14_STRMM